MLLWQFPSLNYFCKLHSLQNSLTDTCMRPTPHLKTQTSLNRTRFCCCDHQPDCPPTLTYTNMVCLLQKPVKGHHSNRGLGVQHYCLECKARDLFSPLNTVTMVTGPYSQWYSLVTDLQCLCTWDMFSELINFLVRLDYIENCDKTIATRVSRQTRSPARGLY